MTPDRVAVQVKLAPTGNGPAHVVPDVGAPSLASSKTQASPDTVPLVDESLTTTSTSGSVPSLVIAKIRSTPPGS